MSLNNSITLYPVAATPGTTKSVSIVDTDNGKTVRLLNEGEGFFTRLTTAATTTQENKPIITDRFLIRLDLDKTSNVDPAAVVRASAYLVVSLPRAQFGIDEATGLVQALLQLILQTTGATTPTTTQLAAMFAGSGTADTFLRRILSGEL
jgi:hypothetical protein